MRWQIANEARSAELAIIISYPTSASGIIVLLKTLQNRGKLDWNGNKTPPKIHVYAYHICRVWYSGSYTMANQISWIALYNDPVFNKHCYVIEYRSDDVTQMNFWNYGIFWDILKVHDEECLLAKNQYLIAIWGWDSGPSCSSDSVLFLVILSWF